MSAASPQSTNADHMITPDHQKNESSMGDIQKLQDMLAAMQQQRDQALNVVVVAQAENAALRRTLAERDAMIKDLIGKTEKRTTESQSTPAHSAMPISGFANGPMPIR